MIKYLLSLLLLVVCTASITAQKPKLMLPMGHTGSVSSAVFNLDGNRIVTTSQDNTAKIWDAQTGHLLQDLMGHTQSVKSAVFSPNGSRILTASDDYTAKVWDVQTGQLLLDLKGHTRGVKSAVFSPDGSRILTASDDYTTKVWDVQTGQLLLDLKGHTRGVISAMFSPDGKRVMTVSEYARIWDVYTGQLLLVLKDDPSYIVTAVFSRDGNKVLTASNNNFGSNRNSVKVWDAHTGERILELQVDSSLLIFAIFSPDGKRILTARSILENTAKIWDTQTGQLLLELNGHTSTVIFAVFSPDEKRILTTSLDNSAKVWDAQTGKILLELKGSISQINFAAFSLDGKRMLTASSDVKIWDVQTGQLLLNLKGHTAWAYSAVFSPDGKRVLTASSHVKVWEVQTGKLLLELKGHTSSVYSAVFSANGKRILTASFDQTAKVWDAQTGQLLLNLKGHKHFLRSAVFSPDEKRILTSSWDQTAKIWDTQTGHLLQDLEANTKEGTSAVFSPDGKLVLTSDFKVWEVQTGKLLMGLNGISFQTYFAVFSSNGKRILTVSSDQMAKVWDGQSGQLLLELKGHTSNVNNAVFSPDEKRILTSSWDQTAKIWDAQSGQLLLDLKGHTSNVNNAVFSRDGKRILTSSLDQTVKIWDAQSGQLLLDLKSHSGLVNSAHFSPDEKHILTASQDNTCKLWNTKNGELLYTFIAVDSTDYLVVDKDGRYSGTENARKLIYYVCNDEVIELEQVKDLAWEPDLVAKIMGVNQNPITATGLPTDICGRLPKIEEKGKKQGLYYFLIQPGTGGVGEVRLYVNGKHIGQPRSVKGLPLRNGGYEIAIPEAEVAPYLVKDFDNQIYLRAKTADNSLISRGPIEPQVSSSTMTLNPDTHIYILSVGISQFKNPILNLRFSSKDAVDFGKAMKNSAAAWVGAAKTHLYLLHSEAANPAERPEKSNVAQAMAEIDRQATANDLLICYFSGHGAKSNLGEFYFLNPQASQFEIAGVEKNIGISRTEIQDWLRKITAKNQVLILDACNSADVALVNTKDLSSEHIKALDDLRGNTGSYVLTASSGAAYESSVYNQGLLTYGLLWGIKTGAAAPNGLLRVNTMFGEAIKQTRLLAQNIGGMQDPKLLGNGDIAIGVVNETVQKEIVLAKAKPVVSRSSFSLKASKSDKERLSSLADQVLKELSQRISESNYVFVADVTANPQAAYSLRGEYQVQSNELTITYELYQGEEVATQFPPLKGPLEQKEALAKEMVEKLRGYLEEKK